MHIDHGWKYIQGSCHCFIMTTVRLKYWSTSDHQIHSVRYIYIRALGSSIPVIGISDQSLLSTHNLNPPSYWLLHYIVQKCFYCRDCVLACWHIIVVFWDAISRITYTLLMDCMYVFPLKNELCSTIILDWIGKKRRRVVYSIVFVIYCTDHSTFSYISCWILFECFFAELLFQ